MSHGTIAHENSKEHKVKKKLLQAVFVICSIGLGTQTATAGGVSFELLGNATYSMATGTPTPTSGLAFPGVASTLISILVPRQRSKSGVTM